MLIKQSNSEEINMKRILVIALTLMLLSPMLVLAQQEGAQMQQGDPGEPQLISAGLVDTTRVRAQSAEELRAMVQQREQEMNQELEGVGSTERNVYQNQNQVRLAVHAMLAMEELAGNRGQQIAAVAREYNNSVQATIQAEEKIQNRNFLSRLFMGGDSEAAEEIESEVNQNQERITNLKRYMNECDCGSEVKTMLQEQIQNLEQEQNRLGELAQNEKQNKGLFGWLFN
jgi:DNA repair exonuclease SbcCD ATPase subunit